MLKVHGSESGWGMWRVYEYGDGGCLFFRDVCIFMDMWHVCKGAVLSWRHIIMAVLTQCVNVKFAGVIKLNNFLNLTFHFLNSRNPTARETWIIGQVCELRILFYSWLISDKHSFAFRYGWFRRSKWTLSCPDIGLIAVRFGLFRTKVWCLK